MHGVLQRYYPLTLHLTVSKRHILPHVWMQSKQSNQQASGYYRHCYAKCSQSMTNMIMFYGLSLQGGGAREQVRILEQIQWGGNGRQMLLQISNPAYCSRTHTGKSTGLIELDLQSRKGMPSGSKTNSGRRPKGRTRGLLLSSSVLQVWCWQLTNVGPKSQCFRRDPLSLLRTFRFPRMDGKTRKNTIGGRNSE